MKTFKESLHTMNEQELYYDLKQILTPYFDDDFIIAENHFNRAVAEFRLESEELLNEFLSGYFKKLWSDVSFAYSLGYKANLHHFHHPELPPFFESDPSAYLQEYVMCRMPGHAEADQMIQNIIRSAENLFYEKVLYPISEYFAFFEYLAPKYAHFRGFLDADEQLYFTEPGYIKDTLFSSRYKNHICELHGIDC